MAGEGKDGRRPRSATDRRRLEHRLARIEGQVGALRRRVGDGRIDDRFLIQVAAVRGALSQAAAAALEEYLDGAFGRPVSPGDRERVSRVIRSLLRQS